MAKGKKTGGRIAGTPNRKTAADREYVRDFARSILERPDYVASLNERLLEGKAQHMEPILFHYAFGKPKESVEHAGTLNFRWQSS